MTSDGFDNASMDSAHRRSPAARMPASSTGVHDDTPAPAEEAEAQRRLRAQEAGAAAPAVTPSASRASRPNRASSSHCSSHNDDLCSI